MRVCVFIDGGNFYKSCQRNLGGRTDVNLSSLATFLVGPTRELVRTYYYTARLPADADRVKRQNQEKFFSALTRAPYLELRLGKMVRREDECRDCHAKHQRWQEKGVDMRIGVDMLALASKGNYDVAILVSGDGDLREAVQAVKDLGKHVELATFAVGRSDELVQVADVIKELRSTEMTSMFLRP